MERTAGDYVVVIVLDPAFGDRIIEIGRTHDIWITPSDLNREAANKLWKLVEHEQNPPLVSMWSAPRIGETEAEWLGILQDIEIHHGDEASDPVVNALRVIGAIPEPHVLSALAAYGYKDIEPANNEFTAWRVPSNSR